mmetsp:Transcript_14327/g.45181  ORF Transcript_14327/g.45181 Transcript_14327/m.45181 type:complete len:223 (-) Transcript_14327:736-1404(-)
MFCGETETDERAARSTGKRRDPSRESVFAACEAGGRVVPLPSVSGDGQMQNLAGAGLRGALRTRRRTSTLDPGGGRAAGRGAGERLISESALTAARSKGPRRWTGDLRACCCGAGRGAPRPAAAHCRTHCEQRSLVETARLEAARRRLASSRTEQQAEQMSVSLSTVVQGGAGAAARWSGVAPGRRGRASSRAQASQRGVLEAWPRAQRRGSWGTSGRGARR